MESKTLFVGMDVHKETISVAVLRGREKTCRPAITIANEPNQIEKLVNRLRGEGEIVACYEAGACGYAIYRQFEKLHVNCQVIAPGLIPIKATDRIKTDRRDAEKLARLLRAGELTPIRIPSANEECVRDLVRCREALRRDSLRDRHRLLKFLLRRGRPYRDGKHWTAVHWEWLRAQRFDDPFADVVFREYLARLEATRERIQILDKHVEDAAEFGPNREVVGRLKCLRGIDTLTAVAVTAEICDFARFSHPSELMAFVGLVPSEHSSGGVRRRGAITKTGNVHVRRLLVEAAWHYRHSPRNSRRLTERWRGQPEAVIAHARKAQERLHRRHFRLVARGKPTNIVAVAIARELCGFLWAIANCPNTSDPFRGPSGAVKGKLPSRVAARPLTASSVREIGD
jgi:transposase